METQYQGGAILDGFPRTKVQVECLKMLFDKMNGLRREFADSPELVHFKQPTFDIMVLFVDEAGEASPARCCGDGKRSLITKRSNAPGLASFGKNDQPTSMKTWHNRYRVFKEQTYDALVSLKQLFHYHFINAQAPLEVVQENILHELEYQSSLELEFRSRSIRCGRSLWRARSSATPAATW